MGKVCYILFDSLLCRKFPNEYILDGATLTDHPPIELGIIYVCLGTYTRLSMPFPAPQFNPNERVGCFNNFRMSHDIAYCNL